jgi:HK97 family phage major capsid protein
MRTIREMCEARSKLFEDATALTVNAEKHNKGIMSPEDDAKFNLMHDEIEELSRQIQRREFLEKQEKELAKTITPGVPPALDTRAANTQKSITAFMGAEARKALENRAFDRWIRFGFDGLDPEQRSIMLSKKANVSSSELSEEVRAQAVGTGSAGGFLVPQGFSNELEKALKAFGGMRTVARLLPTPSGNDIPWPTVDDTANVGELLAENIGAGTQDVTFGQVILKAYKYSSKVVLVSMELMQDSFFDVATILRDLLAERIGRITNTHFTTGDNTGKPQGVVPASGVGKVGIAGQTTSVLYIDLVDLEHSLDPLYRPGASFMMADSSLKVIKKILDTTGRPIWQPGAQASLQTGQESFNTILGYPYQINQDIPVMAANAKSIIFGNFSKYIVRDVLEYTLLRFDELYAVSGQVGFLAFARADGRTINAAALKHYANSAT